MIKNDQRSHLFERSNERKVSERNKRETHSYVSAEEIIGRDDDENEIINHLLASNDVHAVSVIPILGIGGLGKMRLLSSI